MRICNGNCFSLKEITNSFVEWNELRSNFINSMLCRSDPEAKISVFIFSTACKRVYYSKWLNKDSLTATAFSSDLQAIIVWAPILANVLAVSYPIPALPPVTTTTFPFKSTLGKERLPPILPSSSPYCVAVNTELFLFYVSSHVQLLSWKRKNSRPRNCRKWARVQNTSCHFDSRQKLTVIIRRKMPLKGKLFKGRKSKRDGDTSSIASTQSQDGKFPGQTDQKPKLWFVVHADGYTILKPDKELPFKLHRAVWNGRTEKVIQLLEENTGKSGKSKHDVNAVDKKGR